MTNKYLTEKLYGKYMLPTMLLMLASSVGSIIDSMFAANVLGEPAMQALNLLMPFLMIFPLVGTMLGAGGGLLWGKLTGENDTNGASAMFSMTMLVGGIISLVLTALVYLFLPQIAEVLTPNAELCELAKLYLYGWTASIPLQMFVQMFFPFADKDSDPNLALVAISILCVLTVVLDWFFLEILNMGMFGIAVATFFCYLFCALAALAHFFKKTNTLKLNRKCFSILRKTATVCKLGFPSATNLLAFNVRVLLINSIIVMFSFQGALSAFAVLNNVSSLAVSLTMGAAYALMPLLSIFLGERDYTAIRHGINTSLKFGLALACGLMVLLLLVPQFICAAFGIKDALTMQVSCLAIRLFAISLPINMLNQIFPVILQSLGRVTEANVWMVLRSLVFSLIGIGLFIFPMGALAIWLCFLFAEIVSYVAFALIYSKKAGKITLNPFRIELLAKDKAESEHEAISMEISIKNNIQDVVYVAEKISNFCMEHEIDKRRSTFIGMCAEEMTRNIVQYGFMRKTEHFIDLKLVLRGDQIMLRIRDDGKNFNPLNHEITDIMSNIGIQLVRKIAKNVDYKFALQLNNLVITL